VACHVSAQELAVGVGRVVHEPDQAVAGHGRVGHRPVEVRHQLPLVGGGEVGQAEPIEVDPAVLLAVERRVAGRPEDQATEPTLLDPRQLLGGQPAA